MYILTRQACSSNACTRFKGSVDPGAFSFPISRFFSGPVVLLSLWLFTTPWLQGEPVSVQEGNPLSRPQAEARLNDSTEMPSSDGGAKSSLNRFERSLRNQIEYHPALSGDRLRHSSRQSRATFSDFVYPDPELSFSTGRMDQEDIGVVPLNPMIRKGESYEVQIRQPIPFPGKLTAEANIDEHRAHQAGFEFQMNRNRTIAQLLSLLAQYHRLQASLRLTEELAGAARALEGIARARYGTGRGSLSDVSLARVQADSFNEKAEMLRGEIASIERRLEYFAVRVRAPEGSSSESTSPGPSPDAGARESKSPDSLHPLLLEKKPFQEYLRIIADRSYESEALPVVARMRAIQNQSESRDTLARLQYTPDLGVFAAYGRENRDLIYPSGSGRQTTYKLGIQIKVPLWSGLSNHKNVEAADLERKAAAMDRLDVEKEMESRIQALEEQIRQGRKRQDIFEKRLIPNAWTARRSSVLSYQGGSADFTSVIQAWNAYYDTNLQKLALEEELALWIITRSELANTFLNPSVQDSTSGGNP